MPREHGISVLGRDQISCDSQTFARPPPKHCPSCILHTLSFFVLQKGTLSTPLFGDFFFKLEVSCWRLFAPPWVWRVFPIVQQCWQSCWLVGWQVGRLADWLAGWPDVPFDLVSSSSRSLIHNWLTAHLMKIGVVALDFCNQ